MRPERALDDLAKMRLRTGMALECGRAAQGGRSGPTPTTAVSLGKACVGSCLMRSERLGRQASHRSEADAS